MGFVHFPVHFPLIFVIFWSLPALEAALVNITIDDSGTDPITGTSIVYSPPDSWSPGQTCTDCQAHPDPSLALDHTWHDVLYIPANNVNLTASLQFEGSAIYVFCILAHTSSPLDGNSDMSFSIDGQVVGNFIQPPNGDPNFSYNSPVYVNTSISAGAHTFMLQNGRQGGQAALALLDYIIYSRDDAALPTPISSAPTSTFTTPSSTLPTPAISTPAASRLNSGEIAGIVIGVIGVICLFVIALLLFLRNRSRRVGRATNISTDLLAAGPNMSQVEVDLMTASSPPPAYGQLRRDLEPQRMGTGITPFTLQPRSQTPTSSSQDLITPPDSTLNTKSSARVLTGHVPSEHPSVMGDNTAVTVHDHRYHDVPFTSPPSYVSAE